ncbi:MAG: response regulator transcription factor [Muribaculaceae bacterium]|nr:response regulator transcription factor [Muribaculaceae bacterium]MDE7110477.1 response regulator transcription factor [Muribaculaceae bacterium]
MRVRILIIDDEESICEILKYNLEKEGYEVNTANSAEQALTMDLHSYQLFIVDIMMDKLSGFDFAGKLKNSETLEDKPIIFCTALADEDDTVMGLNLGADDYITKPFSIPEMVARVRSVLRRSNVPDHIHANRSKAKYEVDIIFQGLRLNRNEKTCYIDGQQTPLSRTEFDLLLFFLEHRNRVYSREEIIRNVWTNVVSNRTVDTSLTRLRTKLGAYGKHIETRVGFGYGFKENV